MPSWDDLLDGEVPIEAAQQGEHDAVVAEEQPIFPDGENAIPVLPVPVPAVVAPVPAVSVAIPNGVPGTGRVQTRSWLGTWFFPNRGAGDAFLASFIKPANIAYVVFGRELCPTTQRFHLQWFAYFSSKIRRSQLVTAFGADPGHTLVARGSPNENVTYCTKGGDFREFGDRTLLPNTTAKGGGCNSARAVELFNKRKRIRDVLGVDGKPVSYNAVKLAEYHAKYSAARPVRMDAVEVTWIYGTTGTGKSRYVSEVTDGEAFRPINHKWWEGYDGHPIVVLDDMRGDFCKFHELLKLLDIYPYRVESKGGSRELLAHTIFVTAPVGPDAMFSHKTDEQLAQLTRRVHNVIELLSPGELEGRNGVISITAFSQGILHKGSVPTSEHIKARELSFNPPAEEDA